MSLRIGSWARALPYLVALAAELGCHSFENGESTVVRAPAAEAQLPSENDAPRDADPAPIEDAGMLAISMPPVVVGLPDAGVGDPDPGDVVVGPPPEPAEVEDDLTFPCQTDADCNFGACYVPGVGADGNPICSKRCDADADCPEGALCAAPLECTDGVGCEGNGYCFRACQADAECTVYNPRGTLPTDDPVTGNPVVCVH